MINRRKLHVVLDSVVAVSAFLTEGLTADLVSQCQENVNLYTAEEILQEIRHVLLEKPHIRNRYTYSSEKVDIFIDYRTYAQMVGAFCKRADNSKFC